MQKVREELQLSPSVQALGEQVEAQLRSLEELEERCGEPSCSGRREAVLAALWRRLSRLHRCTRKLAARSSEKVTEWSQISHTVRQRRPRRNTFRETDSLLCSQVERASAVLGQVEAELPAGAGPAASSEELQELLQSWEQFGHRLDCEQRALSALELRTARLLGVPAHLEQAPPTPLCQKLQAMQARYSR